jgi:hypothetical protein
MTRTVDVALIGKAGCHLCDEARITVAAVLGEFRATNTGVARHVQVNYVEHDSVVDDDLRARFSDEIPVVMINGKVHNYWRIDPVRLRAALDDFAY